MANIKRIQKETEMHKLFKFHQYTDKKLWITDPKHSIYMGHDESNIYFQMLVDDQLCHITIQFGKWYPFTPPQRVLLNHQKISYAEVKQSIPMSIYRKFHQYLDVDVEHIHCCCHSILENWAPSYGFTTVLDEVHNHLSLQKKLTYLIYSKHIMEVKLGFIIPYLYTLF